MTNDKFIVARPDANACPIAILQTSDQVTETAFDDAIRARLMHVMISVGNTDHDRFDVMSVTGTGKSMAMIVNLSIHLSLAEQRQRQVQGSLANGVLLIPASLDASPKHYDVDTWSTLDETATRWKTTCTTIHHNRAAHCDEFETAVGDDFTLRLVFHAWGKRQTSVLAKELSSHFSAWERLSTSLREAMRAIRSVIVESEPTHASFVRMHYVGATVARGWSKRIADPAAFLGCCAGDDAWLKSRMPVGLAEMFAARCEAVWSDTAKLLQAPDNLNNEQVDGEIGDDAAHEFVCSDKMMSLWYGERKRPHHQG